MKRNSVWIPIEHKNAYLDSDVQGLRLHFTHLKINEELRRHCIKFCNWLRKDFWFPLRCNVYFEYFTYYRDREKKGDNTDAMFYAWKYSQQGVMIHYPSIRIAVAKYEKHIGRHGQEAALFHYFRCIIHELTHYFQWYFFEFDKRSDRSLEIEAYRWERYIIQTYKDQVYCKEEVFSDDNED